MKKFRMYYLSSLVALLLFSLSSCTNSSKTADNTEIHAMDSVTKDLDQTTKDLENQADKVEASLEKIDKEFEKAQ